MPNRTVDDLVADAQALFDLRYHCSEAIAISTCRHYLDPFPAEIAQISCPFGGGVGGCRDELCGLLSGAVVALGALWGRQSCEEDDKWLYEVVCEYRDGFIQDNGTSVCRPLRDYYAQDGGRCGPLVADATRKLIELIERVAEQRPEAAARLARRVHVS
ncbi:MAG: C_GCAxxG_C_C family protein [Chloroflexi bacterium]|nr:C_GCAxxG_C_C family protein [Chloroflexota bacterium]